MSADNGIYILKTKDGKHCVKEIQAVDNLFRDYLTMKSGSNFIPSRLLEYFGESKYTYDSELAMKIANSMHKKMYICEYGIVKMFVPMTWKQIVKQGVDHATKELENLSESGIKRWQYNIKSLKNVIDRFS